MKVSLLTAAALVSLFGLAACTSQSNSSAPASPGPTTASTASAPPSVTAEAQSADPAAAQPTVQPTVQPTTPAADSAPSAAGKVHFTGDYTKTTVADSADSVKIIELAKQWHSADKEALFHERMDGSGLSSHVPAEQAEAFYGQAAVACQRRFDGYAPPLQGVWLEIENLALSVYCPELR